MGEPDCLTRDFLEKLLQDNDGNPGSRIVITDHQILQPFPKGTSHLSTVFRVDIVYKIICTTHNGISGKNTDNKTSLIVKIPILEGDLAPLIKLGVFDKELHAFNELVPKLQAIMHDEIEDDILPKYYKTDQASIVILEDLSSQGFIMGDRIQQLDYEHGLLVIKQLAKYHAACVRLQETDPEIIDELGTELVYKRNMDKSIKEYMDPMIGEGHVEMICREFEKWPETKKFINFLTKLKPKVWDLFLGCEHPNDSEFVVLIHGDLWTNNILFKYDENSKPKSLKFLDFQMVRSTSPAVDIFNFFYTSIRYDELRKHYEDLTNTYLEHLNHNLEKYGSAKRLKETEFRKSLESREIYGLIRCVNILPYFFAEFEEPEEDGEHKEMSLADYLKSERYRRVCASCLEDFSKKAWFQNFK